MVAQCRSKFVELGFFCKRQVFEGASCFWRCSQILGSTGFESTPISTCFLKIEVHGGASGGFGMIVELCLVGGRSSRRHGSVDSHQVLVAHKMAEMFEIQ